MRYDKFLQWKVNRLDSSNFWFITSLKQINELFILLNSEAGSLDSWQCL